MLASAKSVKRVWVDSRVIRSVGHFALPNGMLSVLEIEQRGREYRTILQFYGAPQELAQELAEATSKASVFYRKVEGVYPCKKVDWDGAIFSSPEWRKFERLPPGVKLKQRRYDSELWGWAPDPAGLSYGSGTDPDGEFYEDEDWPD